MRVSRIISLSAMLAASLTTLCAFASEPHRGGHLHFGNTVCDFGDIPRRGGDISADFEFENDGDEPVVITGVTVSCSCIRPEYSRRPVEAGGRGVVRLVYEPHKMAPGTFYKAVQVHCNTSSGQQNTILTVRGHSVNVRKLK